MTLPTSAGNSAHLLGSRPGSQQVNRLLVLQVPGRGIGPVMQQQAHNLLLQGVPVQPSGHVQHSVPVGLVGTENGAGVSRC